MRIRTLFNPRLAKRAFLSYISTISAQYSYASARLLKYFSLIIRFASSGRARRIFAEHFSLFPRLAFHATSSLFSLRIYTYTHTRARGLSCILLPFRVLFHVPRNTPDILDSNSIARFSSRKSLPSRWLCPIPPCDLREPFSYLPSRVAVAATAFSIPTPRPLSAGLLLRDKI